MSHADYFKHLLKIGMGWLGWSEDQTLDSTMPIIELAYEGRIDMLKFHRGDPPNDGKSEPPPRSPITPELFDAIFG